MKVSKTYLVWTIIFIVLLDTGAFIVCVRIAFLPFYGMMKTEHERRNRIRWRRKNRTDSREENRGKRKTRLCGEEERICRTGEGTAA